MIENPGSNDRLHTSLPPELVDHIFHDACLLSTSFCITLSQTSTWTRRLTLPYLYLTVIIKKLQTAILVSKMLRQPPFQTPAGFLPMYCIRSLWIEAASSMTLAFFRSCDNASSIALNEDNFYWLVHASSPAQNPMSILSHSTIRRKPDLKMLILHAKNPDWHLKQFVMLPPDTSSPLFDKITHLWIGKIGPYNTHLDLVHFNRLSHIAIPYHRPQDQTLSDLLCVFDFPATLFLAVVLLKDLLTDAEYQEGLKWVVETRRNNPKVFVLASRHDRLQSEWEEEVRYGRTIWDKAERFTQSLTP